MKIKNYIVDNYQLLMSCLEEELCKNGISYVRIDNEIHFQDQIIRFYDMEIDFNAIVNWCFSKIETREIEIGKARFDALNSSLNLYKPDDCYCLNKLIDMNESSYYRMNKSKRKYESYQVNQKLKKYSR